MKISVENWSLKWEQENKVYYIAVPPAKKEENRIDIISQQQFDKMSNYHLDVDCIIIEIKDGEIKNIIY